MGPWIPFPFDSTAYDRDDATLLRLWPRLHAGDALAPPDDERLLRAWRLFHAGAFREAVEAGLAEGAPGITVANKAQAVYAGRLEPREPQRLALFAEVAARAEQQLAASPDDANAHYWMAYALSRSSLGLRLGDAQASGAAGRIKSALETAIRLSPRHADAHLALANFHADVIDASGALLGRTQGASRDAGLTLYRTALKINPDSAIARIDYAAGLLILEGERRADEATRLFEEAAACTPMDATERLDVERARAQLGD